FSGLPALMDIRTTCLLTDRVQASASNTLFHVFITRAGADLVSDPPRLLLNGCLRILLFNAEHLASFRLNRHKFHPPCCVILNSCNYDTDLAFVTPSLGVLKALVHSILPVGEIFQVQNRRPGMGAPRGVMHGASSVAR